MDGWFHVAKYSGPEHIEILKGDRAKESAAWIMAVPGPWKIVLHTERLIVAIPTDGHLTDWFVAFIHPTLLK